MKFVVVSGRSGSGKSTALHMLEDMEFYCVDNLPASLLPSMAEKLSAYKPGKIAVGIDARNMSADLERFAELLKLVPSDVELHIIYLDAKDETLIKRFAETRRKHPLSNEKTSLLEALTAESRQLENIASQADLSIDTSEMNLHDLREFIKTRIDSDAESNALSLLFQSFGYKKNVPIDSDIVFDVRCLPNPYWDESLRGFTGNDKPIIDFLSASADAHQMLDDISNYLKRWIPKYEATDRRYVTVSIGCTGGKHRSVFIANQLQQIFSPHYNDVKVRHRQLGS